MLPWIHQCSCPLLQNTEASFPDNGENKVSPSKYGDRKSLTVLNGYEDELVARGTPLTSGAMSELGFKEVVRVEPLEPNAALAPCSQKL